jgi:hypothetical protein
MARFHIYGSFNDPVSILYYIASNVGISEF